MENHMKITMCSRKTHYKWPCSIAVWAVCYQDRVPQIERLPINETLTHCRAKLKVRATALRQVRAAALYRPVMTDIAVENHHFEMQSLYIFCPFSIAILTYITRG